MILPNVRRQLTRNDAQFAARIIARESGEALAAIEARLADEGIDAVLDDPCLEAGLLERQLGALASFPLFAYVVVRRALQRHGILDRALVDYVASVLVHFGIGNRATRIGDGDDQIYETLAALLDDVDDPDGRRSFLVRTHLGNYALWLSGLFPDHIEHRRWRRGGPDLGYYEALGQRGFELAARHRLAEQYGMAPLYGQAAERFAALRVALNAISDRLLFANVHTPEKLMRQVHDESRWRNGA
jgi:hypothetical protein